MLSGTASAPGAHQGDIPLVDTHAHLTGYAAVSPDALLHEAREAGMVRLLAVGTTQATSTAAVACAASFPEVFAAVGIHPNEITPADDLAAIARLAEGPRVRAIGETGLDYYRDRTDPARQRSSLRAHLELAAARDLPIVIHCRAAEADLAALLAEYSGRVRGVMHCFSGDLSFAERMLDLGYFLSFAGNLTYPSAATLREVASWAPPDRLLLETDSPYLAPIPHRGKPNRPALVVHTLHALAACRGQEPAAMGRQVLANAASLFGW